MIRSKFMMLAAGVLAAAFVVAVATLVAPPVFEFHAPASLASLVGDAMVFAGPTLLALRAELTDLETRAAAKQGELKDGLSADEVRKIEAEHRELLDKIVAKRGEVAEAERAAPSATDTVAVERARSAEITTLAQRHAMPAEFASQHIASGTSIEEVRKIVLEEVAKRSAGTAISPRVAVTQDEGDTIRAAVENSILHRANPAAVQLDDAARQFRGMSLLEAGRSFVEDTQGVKLRSLSKRELAGVLLGLDRRSGMMATTDFPQLLANVASKRLRDMYRQTVQTWRPLCRRSDAPDFKERAIVALAGMPELKKVKEGGEYTYASLGETAEKYSLATYGRIIAITRQTLINDDLGAFDRLPTMFGRAAAEHESDLVWGVILANANMADGVALFHANHGNLGTGAALGEAGVAAGEQAIGEQQDAAKRAMNLVAKFLIVAPKDKLAARKLLTAVTATKTGDVNVYQNSMDLIVENRLKVTSGAQPWYLGVDPAQWDTIEYAYLEGEDGIYTEERMGFEVDGVEIKGRLDFAAKAIDHRGLYKNPGV